jgi:hypothetical protein
VPDGRYPEDMFIVGAKTDKLYKKSIYGYHFRYAVLK